MGNALAILQSRFAPSGEPQGSGSDDPDTRIGKSIRQVGLLSAVLVLGIGSASALVPIGGAIIGSGQVGVETNVKKIAHPLGGTIADILVRNGQHVRKGQILIRLDDTVSGSDAELAALTVDQAMAQKARLEAEQLGAPAITFPAALARRTDPSARKAMEDERRMFAMRRSEGAGMRAQLVARVSQYEQQIAGYRAQIASLHQQRSLMEPQRDSMRTLYEKKLVTLDRLNQLERTAVDLTGSIGSLNAQIAATEARISETREQLIQLGQTRRTDAGNQLTQVNAQFNQQEVRRVSAVDAHDRSVIRAPVDGVVDKMAVTTIGGVVRPADTLLEIVPDRSPMVVEGAISPNDVDRVQTAQPARIRLSGIGGAITPELRGRITYVGADRVTSPDGLRSYFPVRVSIDPAEVRRYRALVLKPGMPAEIFIETGERSMLSYLTRPLRDQAARAFRDH